MTWKRSNGLRQCVAIFCIAIATLLSAQAYISLVDRIEHAHHRAHLPNPLAGDIEFCASEAACGYKHIHEHIGLNEAEGGKHADQDGVQEASEQEKRPVSQSHDHQHGAPTVAFLVTPTFELAVCPLTQDRCAAVPTRAVSISPPGQDRPPKQIS